MPRKGVAAITAFGGAKKRRLSEISRVVSGVRARGPFDQGLGVATAGVVGARFAAEYMSGLRIVRSMGIRCATEVAVSDALYIPTAVTGGAQHRYSVTGGGRSS